MQIKARRFFRLHINGLQPDDTGFAHRESLRAFVRLFLLVR